MNSTLSTLIGKITDFLESLSQAKPKSTEGNGSSPAAMSASVLNLRTQRESQEAEVNQILESESEVKAKAVETAPVVNEAPAAPAKAVAAKPAKSEPAVAACHSSKAPASKGCGCSQTNVPEDSALRRHYLTQLKADVLARLPAEPSDSTLKRHYQQLVAAELAKLG